MQVGFLEQEADLKKKIAQMSLDIGLKYLDDSPKNLFSPLEMQSS